ncbi:hypothetical protein TNCV_2346031 [Trichonephila clavipes]|nr:hypothetical protein TNCV_2346031 [Trichonephila clavipes]
MIPILKRFSDSFYMVLVDDKNFPAFLTEYVFNCPELTTIEFQGITQTDGEVEVEFLKLPEGFAYINDVESEFYENAFALVSKYFPEDEEYLTPDVLLDMLITTFIDPIVKMYTDENCIFTLGPLHPTTWVIPKNFAPWAIRK